MKSRLLMAAVLAASLASVAPAQYSLYWELPSTPGDLSLGLAGLAVSDAPEGLGFDPSVLSEVGWRTARASALQWWQDVYAGTFSGALPVKPLGTAGFALGYWSLGSMTALSQQGEPLGSIEPKSVLWEAALGRRIFSGLGLGLAAKGYSLIMPDRKDWGWAVDAGARYHYRFLTGMAAARNLGPKYPVNSAYRFDLPASADLGLAASLLGNRAEAGLVFTASKGREPVVSAGLEIKPFSFAGLRLGLDNDDSKPERSPLGLGLALMTTGAQDYSVEYGYRSYGALGDVHAFSVGVDF